MMVVGGGISDLYMHSVVARRARDTHTLDIRLAE